MADVLRYLMQTKDEKDQLLCKTIHRQDLYEICNGGCHQYHCGYYYYVCVLQRIPSELLDILCIELLLRKYMQLYSE